MTDQTPPLLPCPFCGSAAQMHQVPMVDGDDNAGGYYIECDNRACSMTTALRFSCGDDCRPALIETWNRRAPDTQVAPSPPPSKCGWPNCSLTYDHRHLSATGEPSPPVAPDSLVADLCRLSDWLAASVLPGYRLQAPIPARAAARLEQLQRELEAQRQSERLKDQAIDRALSRLALLTQAADAMRDAYVMTKGTDCTCELCKTAAAYDAIRSETPAPQAGQPADESRKAAPA